MEAALRRVIIVTETPESKQPYSMLHRALYANIVGHDTLYTSPHGCTIKQYDGEDYIVDHVTRLARPVSHVPALSAHKPELIRKANEYHTGIVKCQSVLQNLETRLKAGHAQLSASQAKTARYEETLRAQRERKSAFPIAAVIAERCQDLYTVTALLSLVAQALRAPNTQSVRDLTPVRLQELERVAQPLYEKFVQWKSGELKLREKGEEEPLGEGTMADHHAGDGEDALLPEEAYEEDDFGSEGDHDDENSLQHAKRDHADVIEGRVGGDSDMEDDVVLPSMASKMPVVTQGASASTEDGGHEDASEGSTSFAPAVATNPSLSDTVGTAVSMPTVVEDEVATKEEDIPTPEASPEDMEATASFTYVPPVCSSVEEHIPQTNEEGSATDAEKALLAPLFVVAMESTPAATETADIPTTTINATTTEKTQREATLYLPECGQPNVAIHCSFCNAYFAYDAHSLEVHDASPRHSAGSSGHSPILEVGGSVISLPSFATHRAIPKRHVRLDDDNSFGRHYSVVRTGCTSCRTDVTLDKLVSHGTTQEHLDFWDE